MKRQRIAHVIQHFAEGELESLTAELATRATEHEVERIVIGYLGDGPLRAELEASGVRTHLLPLVEGASHGFARSLAALLAQEAVDAVHTHQLGALMFGARAASMLGIAAVHTARD
jgi:predicted Fe-Mo cluster-binding NifX family protein